MKNAHRHWLGANMGGEASWGSGVQHQEDNGQDTINFLKFRQNIAECKTVGYWRCLRRSSGNAKVDSIFCERHWQAGPSRQARLPVSYCPTSLL